MLLASSVCCFCCLFTNLGVSRWISIWSCCSNPCADALESLKKSSEIVCPNDGFKQQVTITHSWGFLSCCDGHMWIENRLCLLVGTMINSSSFFLLCYDGCNVHWELEYLFLLASSKSSFPQKCGHLCVERMQLRIFEEMGCTVNRVSSVYKNFRLATMGAIVTILFTLNFAWYLVLGRQNVDCILICCYKFAKELFLLKMMVRILFNALSFKMSEDPSFYLLMTAKHKIVARLRQWKLCNWSQ